MNYAGRQTLALNEASKGAPIAQISYMGAPNDVPYITPYGFFSSPPVNSSWVVFPLRGNDNDMVGFGNDFVNRPKDLKPSDVCLFNTKSKAKIVLRTTGDIEIYAPKDIKVNADNDIIFTAKNNIELNATEQINSTCKNFNVNSSLEIKMNSALMTNIITTVNWTTATFSITGSFIAGLIRSLTDLIWTRTGDSQSVDIHKHSTTGNPPVDQ